MAALFPPTTSIMSRKIVRFASVLIALAVWFIAAVCIAQPLLLPSPVVVIARFFRLLGERDFLSIAFGSAARIAMGLVAGIIAGILLAIPAAKFTVIEDLLWPYMTTIRTVPVVSFIILCLMWLTARKLPGFIAFLMALPIIYNSVLAGLRGADREMNEMARVFQLSQRKRLFYIMFPQLYPHLTASISTAAGLAWKAGAAAELIGIPSGTIGEQLYRSKVYFDTADLFAWTLVIILLSIATEKLLVALLRLGMRRVRTAQ